MSRLATHPQPTAADNHHRVLCAAAQRRDTWQTGLTLLGVLFVAGLVFWLLPPA